MLRIGLLASVLAAIAGCAACTGNIGGIGGAGSSEGGAPSAPGVQGTGSTPGNPGDPGVKSPPGVKKGPDLETLDCPVDAPDPGPAPLRLLTPRQYVNTMTALVGDVAGLEAALGDRAEPSEFGLVQPDVAPVDVETYGTAAELVASAVTADAARLGKLAPCDASADTRACAKAFVERFGALAYRAPLENAEDTERHLALFDAGKTTSYAHGIELLLRGMLQAPRFLYRVEFGTAERVGTRAVKLSGYELAARLSYTAWNAPPDPALVLAAESGALDAKEGVTAELERLLADVKGKTLLRRFLEAYVHVGSLDATVKDATLFPEWTGSGLRGSMQAQAARFFDDVLANQGGTLRALLTSETVFVNRDLASFYGATGGADFTPLSRSDGATSGLLTLPAFLAVNAKPSESSPIYRGKFVREALLCKILPAPPANIPKPPDVTPGVSTRERLREHEVNETCAQCHQLMDPIGFGFEAFDSLGRFRTDDGGKAVDTSGEIVESVDTDGPFSGTRELGERLAGSRSVEECIARQWFRFAMSRFERGMDSCSMKAVVTAFRDADSSLNALPKAIVSSDAFLYRQPNDVADAP